MVEATEARVAVVVQAALPEAELRPESDLWKSGLDSIGSVALLVALEDEFDVEFPNALLTRQTFTSIISISDAVRSIS
ncbi:acyl carrier protein [Micromonospora andamanensis]|uniref:phosphopantetheine-binding protein n=1 Tax=Micromonospora andamanensis TaxID=1287068 RepID=UPI0019520291|nr:phosphopantetheine-binding protein [Micromonospora andamanensis]GIJ38322.1 aminoacyl carrier protein [Micromonospora andamanensis]